ncbi:MAG: NapC/NirT family cytochrome c [candidate division Zixibacteria bacterium]|nr:NapC/NirT family cytochrome c [candidate division Zixibacteria bacterium]
MLPIIIVISIGLAIIITARPEITRNPGGKILAFLALFVLPSVSGVWGVAAHLEQSKKTVFCLSCHPMYEYGKSLLVDDAEFVPAVHYQNNFIPRDKACYTCHTDYTLYGDLNSKIRGLRHLMVFYSGNIPDTLQLYSPYNNRECLNCHSGMRKFEESSPHIETPMTRDSLSLNTLSCLSSGCHDVIHDVHNLDDVALYNDSL